MSEANKTPSCFGDHPTNPADYATRDCATCTHMQGCARGWPKVEAPEPMPNGPYLKDAILKGTTGANPLDVQVAGGHYKSKKIQPVEYIHANGLNFLEGCIVKRITRWRDKPAEHRFQDLEKIKHEVDLLIEMEKRHG